MNNLLNEIGNTPIVFLPKISEKYNAKIFVKLEGRNPGGSIKDRVAYQMLKHAVDTGQISEGGTIIEPTSGNTGIGLALVARFFKLKTILVMPETMSLERRKLLAAYGAELVLTPATKGMGGAVEKAIELQATTENSFMPNQFSNPQCIQAHVLTTAPEIDIFMQNNSLNFDAFLAGVGTGGTISGVGRYFKENGKTIQIIAIEPSTSAVLSGKPVGTHGIQGIGAGFVPENFDREVVDSIYKVSTDEAITSAKELMNMEGISCGISSGANLFCAKKYAKANPDSTILTIIPDALDKYLSTALCAE